MSVSTIVAGFLAVLISLAGPLLILLQAAMAMGIGSALFSSWVFATLISAGLASIVLSLKLRAPILVAWSAPGAVLLISIGPQLAYSEVVGAYLVTAAVILLVGCTGVFDRLVELVPRAVASGMMAGILFQFGSSAIGALSTAPLAFGVLLGAYLLLSAWWPRFVMMILLLIALALAGTSYDMSFSQVDIALAQPELAWPSLSLDALLSLSFPLIITTLTGQFLGGMAILRANGFHAPARPILVLASLAALPAALYGGITTALAAITMALGAGEEADPDPARRYVAGVASGLFLCLADVFAGTIVALLTLLPVEIIALLAGLALLGPIAKGLQDMLADTRDAQAGLLTFIVAASGSSLWGLGAAFWGIVIGLVAVGVQSLTRRVGSRC